MLTTKGQKFWMFCIGFFALLLGGVVLVPFKSIFTCEKIFLIELIVKLGAVPALILLLSIYPNKLKYIQVKGYRNQSRIVSVMSYFPVVIYILTIITESVYLLARGYVINGQPPLGMIPWSLWFVALIIVFVAVACFFKVLPDVEMQLDVKEHVIFDIIVFVVMVCLGALYYLISKATHGIFLKEGPHGDPYLFVVYLGALISFGINVHFIKNLIHADEINMCLRFNDLDATAYVSQMAEYNRAYNDIMERFEEYFAEEESEDEQEEVAEEAAPAEEVVEEAAPVEEVAEEAAPVEEVVEEAAPVEEVAEEAAPAEEVVEEAAPAEEVAEEAAPVEEVVEEAAPVEEVVEEAAPVEEVVEETAPVEEIATSVVPNEELVAKQEEVEKLEQEIEEIRLAKIAEEEAKLAEEAAKKAAREEAARIAEEKALKAKEEMVPSFKRLVQYAKGLDEVSFIENTEKKQIRFFYGKKVFLIMADNPKDYRLQFMVDSAKVVEWWNINSDIRPRSNKIDNWFKLTNKGSFTEELLLEIISSSREFIQAETERIAEEKKAQRAEARKKAKENKEEK